MILSCGANLNHFADSLDVASEHAPVKKQQIGRLLLEQRAKGGQRIGLADDLDVRLGRKNPAHADPVDGLAICDDDANLEATPGSGAARRLFVPCWRAQRGFVIRV